MARPNDYSPGNSPNASSNGTDAEDEGTSVAKLRRQYMDFLGAKDAEISEQRLHRHYYHGDQLTKDQIDILRARGQPETIRDKASRKINGVVGLMERLRQDPKAYPRTPKHEEGAEIATASVRYVLDVNQWEALTANEARDGAINGIFGCEMGLTAGDQGDPDIELNEIDNDTFFYDPRSYRFDFSDARYMGVAKWLDIDVAKAMFPDAAEDLDGLISRSPGAESLQQQDREFKWIDSNERRVFLVEHWYIVGEEWRWCFYVAETELGRGTSPFVDEKGKTICRYILGSMNVDHDGDRYGFLRLLKTLIDELNALVSKRAHLINMRRIIAEKGAVADVDTARKEAVRADGYLEVNPGKRFEFDDQSRLANIQHLNEAIAEVKTEIENFGPNPALIGQGIENKSGRAIALLQQAGIAELGPAILSFRNWKIRVYRAVWNAIRQHWKAERWIRVTDDEGVAQFLQINGLQMDDMGQANLANAVGSLDVDILLDEGPDTLNMMQDSYDALQALSNQGTQIPPAALIELSPLASSVKRKVLAILEQAAAPSEFDQKVMGIKVQEAEGKARKVNAEATKIEGEAETSPMRDRAAAFRDVSSAASQIAKARQPQPAPQPSMFDR
jgi:hypothetical protein